MIRKLLDAVRHDFKLTPELLRRHFLEGCKRCEALYQRTPEYRIVAAVGRGELVTEIIWLCPDNIGRPLVFDSIANTPLEVACSCGKTHETSMADLQVMFRATEER